MSKEFLQVHAVVYLGQAEQFPNFPASHPDNQFAAVCRELLQSITDANNQLCNRILSFAHSSLQKWQSECMDKGVEFTSGMQCLHAVCTLGSDLVTLAR